MQRLSENGNELLKELEGFRSEPYLDTAGVPTIGYGNTLFRRNGLQWTTRPYMNTTLKC
ncbi:glycoside hydrolase family protein [Maribacter dokdonensis]|uniref:glycoside hydrolase family protein n=1 Tax=Maribacter dokdonensis TaxID=320912 RepID=UPI0012F94E3A|nr:hypothetical protein [Maribacter dokdonensis]